MFCNAKVLVVDLSKQIDMKSKNIFIKPWTTGLRWSGALVRNGNMFTANDFYWLRIKLAAFTLWIVLHKLEEMEKLIVSYSTLLTGLRWVFLGHRIWGKFLLGFGTCTKI